MQWLILALLIGLTLAARAGSGTWAHPAPFTGVVWTTFLGLPTLAGFYSATFTALMMAAVVTSATLTAKITVPSSETTPRTIRGSTILVWFVLSGAGSAALSALLVFRANGTSIDGLLTLNALSVAARDVTHLRYSGALVTPGLATFLLAVSFAAAIVAPFAALQYRGWRRVALLASPSLGVALYAAATTVRASFLMTFMLTLGTWLVVTAVESGGRPTFHARRIALLGLAAVGAVAVFVWAAVTRLGGYAPGMASHLLDRATLYAAGGVPAYETWAKRHAEPPTLGTETFAGVFQHLLGDPSLGSAYPEVTAVAESEVTNVYTVLRPLTTDFGVAGAIAFLAAASLLGAVTYRRAVCAGSVTAAVVAGTVMAFFMFGSTTSLLSFTNTTVGILLAWSILVVTVKMPKLDRVDTAEPRERTYAGERM